MDVTMNKWIDKMILESEMCLDIIKTVGVIGSD